MTILLFACTTSLTMRGIDLYKANIAYSDRYGESKPFDVNNLLLLGALVRYFTFDPKFAVTTVLRNGGSSEFVGWGGSRDLDLSSPAHPIRPVDFSNLTETDDKRMLFYH